MSSLDLSSIEGLDALTQLSLGSNQFETIDQLDLGRLINLQYLDLSDNPLGEVNFTKLAECGLLVSLVLRNTSLVTLNGSTFGDNLGHLYLQSNLIEEIEPNTFENLENLVDLNLSTNRLEVLKNGTFDGLSSLERLGLSGNGIVEIEEGAFDDLDNLFYLDLSNNQLSYVNENVFMGLPNMTTIDLRNNSFKDVNLPTNLCPDCIVLY